MNYLFGEEEESGQNGGSSPSSITKRSKFVSSPRSPAKISSNVPSRNSSFSLTGSFQKEFVSSCSYVFLSQLCIIRIAIETGKINLFLRSIRII